MNQDFFRVTACGLCGAVFLASLFHLHDCKPIACRYEPHVHEELPTGGSPIPAVMGAQRVSVSATTSLFDAGHMWRPPAGK